MQATIIIVLFIFESVKIVETVFKESVVVARDGGHKCLMLSRWLGQRFPTSSTVEGIQTATSTAGADVGAL